MGGAAKPGFGAGLLYPLRGLRWVFVEQRSLLKYAAPPIALSGLSLAAVLWFAIERHDAIVQAIWTVADDASWVVRAAHWLFELLVWVASMIVAMIATWLLSGVIAAPFNDALSAATERICGTLPHGAGGVRALLADVARTMAIEGGKVVAFLVLAAPLWLVGAIPVVGPVLSAGLGTSLAVLYLVLDYTDWPASRRGLGWRARRVLFAQHASPMLGFGVGVWLLWLVPGLNLVLMPGAVVGGTLLFLDLTDAKSS